MSVEKAGQEGVTQSKRSGLTLYYYLNACEESAAFQSIYINFQPCFSSTIWELGEEDKLKACLEDTRHESQRHPKNYFLMPLLGDQKIGNMISNTLYCAPYIHGL